MEALVVAPKPPPWMCAPTSNSVPEPRGTPEVTSPGQAAGSRKESNTETQEPHHAFFIYKRSLWASLWKIRMVTEYTFKQKANENEDWRLTQGQLKYINYILQKSRTTNFAAARCQQMWIFPIYLQFLSPGRPICPQKILSYSSMALPVARSACLLTPASPLSSSDACLTHFPASPSATWKSWL